jgi:predicted nucleic acid-binding protein
MNRKLRIVLDTNILLVSISSKSSYHWIFEALLADAFDLYLSTDILLEYEEIIGRKFNVRVVQDVTRTLLALPNVQTVNVFFYWNLIANDPDDNKFADCAVNLA